MFFLQVLIDGPTNNVSRSQLRLNQLHLTKYKLKFPFSASSRVVRKAWNDAKVDEAWAQSMWAKKLAAKKTVSVYCSVLLNLNCLFYDDPTF